MITRLVLSDTPSPLLTATHSTGVRLRGNTSGAIGFIFNTENGDDGTANTKTDLVNVSGTFQVGEKLIASDSAETDKLIENSSNADLTISTIETFKFEDVRAVSWMMMTVDKTSRQIWLCLELDKILMFLEMMVQMRTVQT